MKTNNRAFIMLIFCYIIWGIQPIYWTQFKGIPLNYLLAHRIIWSLVFVFPIIVLTGKFEELKTQLKNRKFIILSFLTAASLGANWLLNIYASTSHQVVEISLGQYITPVVIVFIGAVTFKEPVENYKKIALLMTLIAISTMTLYVGRLPMLAVMVIITFVLYAFFKKINQSNYMIGFIAEIIIMTPFALLYIFFNMKSGTPFFYLTDWKSILWMISTGIFTGYTFLLFSYGIKKVDFTVLGFVQYIAPSIALLLSVVIFHEPFTKFHLLSFIFIWIAILIVIIYPLIYKKSDLL